MSLSGVPESRKTTTGFPTLIEHVYDLNVKYRPVSPLHQGEGDVLFTHSIPAQKVWEQRARIYDKPQEKVGYNLKDSDGLSRITETTKWSDSTHVQLTIKFKDQLYGGSGALVGPHHVLTSGNHVHDGEWAAFITVYPALNVRNAPFGSCKVVKTYTFTQWTEQKDPRYNIALLILNESIGEFTGWNGLLSTPDSYLLNEEVNIVGYHTSSTWMWCTKHQVRKIETEQFYYSNDTQATSSGSAICINKWNTSMIVGVQTLGRDGHQFGVRLSRQKLEVLAQEIARSFKVYPSIAFGRVEWEEYFGDVGAEPPLPSDIHQILTSPCPIWPGKTIQETHLLTLIPATINNQPFTLKTLSELIKQPKTGPAMQFESLILGEYQDNPVPQSYWILMSRDVLVGSRKQTYQTQFDQVARLAQNTGIPYTTPKVLEAATSILMHHVSTEQKLYTDSPWTYTRCQEFYNQKDNCKLVVGGFCSGGLSVVIRWDVLGYGVSVCRKF